MNRRFAFVLFMAVCLGATYQAVAGMRGGRLGGRAGAPSGVQKPLVVPEGYEKVVVTVELPGIGKPRAQVKGEAAKEKPAARRGQPNARAGQPRGRDGQAGAQANQPGGRRGRRGGPGGGGHGGNCPQTQVGETLGLALSQPHGCIVGSVMPAGPAGKAGIKPGDSIVEADGNVVTCPSTFVPYLDRSQQPRKVKLTVLRPKAGVNPAGRRPHASSAQPASKVNAQPKSK